MEVNSENQHWNRLRGSSYRCKHWSQQNVMARERGEGEKNKQKEDGGGDTGVRSQFGDDMRTFILKALQGPKQGMSLGNICETGMELTGEPTFDLQR